MRALLLLAIVVGHAQAQVLDIKRDGYLVLYKDGAEVSRHTVEREAVQKAVNMGPGNYTVKQPDIIITVAKPVVMSSVTGKSPIVYYPACVTSDCRKPTHAEQSAVRARIAANTAAWAALHGNREKMGWHDKMWRPTP